MHTSRIVIVEAEKQNTPRAKLRREVDRLKAGVAATADDARIFKEHFISVFDFYFVHAFVCRAHATIIAQLDAFEIRQAVIVNPPRPITAIDNISERCRSPTFFDCNNL